MNPRRVSVALLTLAALGISLPSSVAAGDPHAKPWWGNGEKLQFAPTGSVAAQNIALNDSPPVYEDQENVGSQVTVYINWIKGAGDDEWRSHYGSSWDDKINAAVERADDEMYGQFGIDFRIWAYKAWDTYPNGPRTCDSIMTELKNDVGVGATNGGDTVVGYTGGTISNAAGCSVAHYALLEIQGSTIAEEKYNEWVTTQHEYGHLYNADDRYGADAAIHPNDVMEDPYGSPDTWCHDPRWNDWGLIYNARATYE